MNGKNMNSQRISFLSVPWLVLTVCELEAYLLQRFNIILFPKFFHFSYILLFDGLLIMKLSLLGKSLLFPQDAVTSLFLEGHFGIHLEVASDSFCFLINSSWLLVFILYVFSLFFLGFNLYCLKGIHFS